MVEDVRGARRGRRAIQARLNLSFRNMAVVPLTLMLKAGIVCAAAVFFLVGLVSAPHMSTFAAPVPGSIEERQALETQLKELETQIDQYGDQITAFRKQGGTLKNEIGALNTKVAKLNLQIKAIKLTLANLDRKITETQSQITLTEEQIGRNKDALGVLLRSVYETDEKNLIEVFLARPRLSDFFGDVNSNALLQRNLQSVLDKITALKGELEEEKTQLSLARADAETARLYRDAQRRETENVKKEKDVLLAETKGQEAKYQTLLKKTQETAAQIRSRLFQLLGGGELTFGQAYQYAKLAGDATGVRPAFILAVLDRESALGQNVGRCKYNEVSSVSGKPAMHPTRDVPAFLEIMGTLGINPNSVTVSCPNSDGSYGGAMGPAQFIPSTWRLYAEKVSAITARNPASPWNNADAFVAAALYLQDAGAAKNERTAAARYYCGGNWNRYVCTNVYGRKVVEQAERFEQDISAIAG